MASTAAKKAAGTYIADELRQLPPTVSWLQEQCRNGVLAGAVRKFAGAQLEMLDPSLVLVESVDDLVHCCIPCRCCDHEDTRTFITEVRFTLNPQTLNTTRL